MAETARTVTSEDRARPRPVYVVWELTLRCDHACAHCGSRAGLGEGEPREGRSVGGARPVELETRELLEVAQQLVDMGTREVTLIGGEAYLRPDAPEVVRFLSGRGVRVTMQTGGLAFTPARARTFKEAGLSAVGVSIDGPADVHDVLRARPGSHAAALRALRAATGAGLTVTANSQVNRLNADRLWETARELEAHGVRVWRAQLTVPMGRAADRPEWLLEPWRIVPVIDTLAAIQKDALERARAAGRRLSRSFHVALGNNVGYFGPHEQLLRSRPEGRDTYWQGCQAGVFTLGIESDGTIKGCPSLPTAPYVGGNVRDMTVAEAWDTPELRFARDRTRRSDGPPPGPLAPTGGPDELWGFCRTCVYADVCRAGCSFTAHCTLGKRGNMPWCYHRATQLARRGVREVLVPVEAAAGTPYDFGRLELREEPLDGA